jgi:exonuclease III
MPGRILYTRITIKGVKLSAFSVYAPTEPSPDTSKIEFYNKLKKAIKSARTDHPKFKIVIGGDMNATIGNDIRNGKFIGKNNDECGTNKNGDMLVHFCEEMEVHAMNTIYQTKKIHRYTWCSPKGYLKRIDYFLVDNFIRRISTNCRVYRGCK